MMMIDDFCYKRVQTPGMSPPRQTEQAGFYLYTAVHLHSSCTRVLSAILMSDCRVMHRVTSGVVRLPVLIN